MTKTQLNALSWAVREAEFLRGALVGRDPHTLLAFDKRILQAKTGLKELRRQHEIPDSKN